MSDLGKHRVETPEEMWAAIRELRESQRETALQMQETDRRMQETDRRLRKTEALFTSQWGKLIESLVDGDLVELLRERGIAVEHTSKNLRQNYGERRWELDILAVNGGEVVAVEVKTTLKVDDVRRFLGFLADFPELVKEYRERKVYGAVAYLKADEASTTYAERKGLFVIRATGGSASITNRADFRPRSFST